MVYEVESLSFLGGFSLCWSILAYYSLLISDNFDDGILLRLFGGMANLVDTGFSSFCFFIGVLLLFSLFYFCYKNKGKGISPPIDLVFEALFSGTFFEVDGLALGLKLFES